MRANCEQWCVWAHVMFVHTFLKGDGRRMRTNIITLSQEQATEISQTQPDESMSVSQKILIESTLEKDRVHELKAGDGDEVEEEEEDGGEGGGGEEEEEQEEGNVEEGESKVGRSSARIAAKKQRVSSATSIRGNTGRTLSAGRGRRSLGIEKTLPCF